MHAVPCTIMRGGTSKGLFFRREALPAASDERDALLLAHGDETVDLHLAVRRNPDEIALGAGRRLWILAAGGPLDEAR